jgi:hypothetical protein
LKNHRGVLGCDACILSHLVFVSHNLIKSPHYFLYCLINIKAQDILINESYLSIGKEIFKNLQIQLLLLGKQYEFANEISNIVDWKANLTN